jgi:hypothetical protein
MQDIQGAAHAQYNLPRIVGMCARLRLLLRMSVLSWLGFLGFPCLNHCPGVRTRRDLAPPFFPSLEKYSRSFLSMQLWHLNFSWSAILTIIAQLALAMLDVSELFSRFLGRIVAASMQTVIVYAPAVPRLEHNDDSIITFPFIVPVFNAFRQSHKSSLSNIVYHKLFTLSSGC